jgi:Na+/melibiose symporter-like transporter
MTDLAIDRRLMRPQMSVGAIGAFAGLGTLGVAIVLGIVGIMLYLGGFDKNIAVLQTQQATTTTALGDIKVWMKDVSAKIDQLPQARRRGM